MTQLTQKQRNEIRYALEDTGVPEVLAFMAARNATPGYEAANLSTLFGWRDSPEGHAFWQMAHAEHRETQGDQYGSGFPDLSLEN